MRHRDAREVFHVKFFNVNTETRFLPRIVMLTSAVSGTIQEHKPLKLQLTNMQACFKPLYWRTLMHHACNDTV